MYSLVIEYQPGAKSIAERIATALKSMAQSELSIRNVQAEFKQSEEPYSGFNITVRTDDLSQNSLLFQRKGAEIVQNTTFVRPCAIALDHVTVALS